MYCRTDALLCGHSDRVLSCLQANVPKPCQILGRCGRMPIVRDDARKFPCLASMSSRYAVAMLTADMRRSVKSLGLYTLEICPRFISISPLVSICDPFSLTALICLLVIPDLRECTVLISIDSRLGLPGRKTSRFGFHSSLVRSMIGRCVLLLPFAWDSCLEIHNCPRGIEGDNAMIRVDAKRTCQIERVIIHG